MRSLGKKKKCSAWKLLFRGYLHVQAHLNVGQNLRMDSWKRPSEGKTSMASVQVESNILSTEWNKNGSKISMVWVASVWEPSEARGLVLQCLAAF